MAAGPEAQAPDDPADLSGTLQPRSAADNAACTAAAPPSGPTWTAQLASLVLWLLVALLLRWLVVEPRWIPSGSMLPTLQLQDRILVEKLRPRLQATLPPGTVVVFHPPAPLVDAGYDPNAALIKRVVAGPGDLVEVRQGRLLLNGSPVEPDWTPESMTYDFGPVTVPQDHLLVLGDNRNASLDSHLWGPLPRQEVIGTAIWRYWPLRRFGPIRFSPSLPPGRP
jgi:signal peptidase I